MTADHILALLATKHSGDLFVPECMTDRAPFVGSPRLDAWIMMRCWKHPRVLGYEIKVARSDFLGDNKWRAYLEYCYEFYFVAPPGIIDVAELPSEAGLLVASKTGSRLFTKKKAPYREVEIPEALLEYVLVCRAKIVKPWPMDRDGQTEQWTDWLQQKREKQELGHNVSRRIRELVQERITAVANENRRIKEENEGLATIKGLCKELEIDITRTWALREQLERAMAKLNGVELCQQLARTEEALAQARSKIAEVTA